MVVNHNPLNNELEMILMNNHNFKVFKRLHLGSASFGTDGDNEVGWLVELPTFIAPFTQSIILFQ